MGRTLGWLAAIVIIILIIAGGYAIFHKSPAKPANTPQASSSTNTSPPKSTASNAVNNDVIETKTNSSVGQYLTDPNNNTLYTIGNSPANCEGSCLSAWPAYQDKGSTDALPNNISTVKRPDNGEIQFTYKGMPLYYFVSDSKGQVTGNGVSGFTVARP